MKTLLAGLACSGLLLAATVSAQPGQTANDNTNSHGSAVNPTPPAGDTTTTTTSNTGSDKTPTTAMRAKCRKQADEQSLTGKTRKQYLHNCYAGNAPQ